MVEPNVLNSRRPGWLGPLLLALSLVTLGLSLAGHWEWRQRFDQLTEIAETHGIADRRPGLVTGMRRDAGPTRASLRLARAILADELDQRWILDLPAGERDAERQRGLERLDIAYDLGVESLGERPSSWEAFLVIGGAEYLRSTRRRDQRQATRELWLAPLEEAHRLAPLQPEPLRFLAAADLGDWSVLTHDERLRAVARLEIAFGDPITFDLLSSSWLRVAPSLNQALAIVPDDTRAWSGLLKYFSRRGDWERYCDARRRLTEVLRREAHERLDEAEDRLRWGDADKGIQALLWVGSNTAPDASNIELMERVLALVPPGVGGEAGERWLRRWLEWSLERCAQAGSCPISAPSLRRLIGLNRDLEPETRAQGLAAAGALREAEQIERAFRKAHGGPLGVEWAPYMVGKARLLAAQSESGEAMALLRQVPLLGRNSVAYWRAHREVALAASDSLEVAAAEAWLATQARDLWARDDWAVERQATQLDIWPATAAAGLDLRLEVAGSGRGILELRWDGSLVDVVPAVDGRAVELRLAVAQAPHSLAIRSHEGAATATAAVRLLPLDLYDPYDP